MAAEGLMVWAKEVAKKTAKESIGLLEKLDKPLYRVDVRETVEVGSKSNGLSNRLNALDRPLNAREEVKAGAPPARETGKVEKLERMEPPVEVVFRCPEGVDRKEFNRQIKGQERGLNSQTVAENIHNRRMFMERKAETGNGRDLEAGKQAQEMARQKAEHSRIEANQRKGMSYSEAKAEAQEWIKTQAALHNPDQIAGGDPVKVSRMGDANVNSSIGAQWRTRVPKLSNEVEKFARTKTPEELSRIKMNVKLTVI